MVVRILIEGIRIYQVHEEGGRVAFSKVSEYQQLHRIVPVPFRRALSTHVLEGNEQGRQMPAYAGRF